MAPESIPVSHGDEKSVAIGAAFEADYLVMKSGEEMRYEFTLSEELRAPVAKGHAVGNIRVMLGESLLGEIPIITTEAADKLSFGKVLRLLWLSMMNMA